MASGTALEKVITVLFSLSFIRLLFFTSHLSGLARVELFIMISAIVQKFRILPKEGAQRVNAETKVGMFMNPLDLSVKLEKV